MKHTILVVDDEKEICQLMTDCLSQLYDVCSAQNGMDAIRLVSDKRPSLVVLDVLMPGLDGLSVCEYLRKCPETCHIPIIMLTGLQEHTDRMQAFAAGADDFISKPFFPDELLLRVKSKIERMKVAAPVAKERGALLSCGNIKLSLSTREVSVDKRPVKLTLLEFKLLEYLIRHKNQLNSRDEVIAHLWGESTLSARALDPHLSSLRKKLEKSEYKIVTVYGNGLMFKNRKSLEAELG